MLLPLGCQSHPQANSLYPSERRRLGTKRNSEKAWHKMAEKSQLSKKKSLILPDENLLFSARIREYFQGSNLDHSVHREIEMQSFYLLFLVQMIILLRLANTIVDPRRLNSATSYIHKGKHFKMLVLVSRCI